MHFYLENITSGISSTSHFLPLNLAYKKIDVFILDVRDRRYFKMPAEFTGSLRQSVGLFQGVAVHCPSS
jgi:hypothetical protein